jgi:hypothetical protein
MPKATYKLNACPSVRMEQIGFPLEGLSQNLVLGTFINMYRGNSSFIKIGQKYLDTLRKDLSTFMTISC